MNKRMITWGIANSNLDRFMLAASELDVLLAKEEADLEDPPRF